MCHAGRVSDPLRPDPAAATAAWAERVRRNREQVERRRLVLPEGGDFYAPIASWFRADPRREGDATLDGLRALIRPGDTVLDIGAGGGRYALPLALHAPEVVAVEPSEGMRQVLTEGMAEHRIDNIRVVDTTWPCDEPIHADVALISHVGYDIEDFGPFLDAMEAAAGRLCIAAMLSRPPPSRADPFWEAVHGEPRDPLPALPEFLALQLARARLCEVSFVEYGGIAYDTEDDILRFLRQQLWIAGGSPQDERLLAMLPDYIHEADGRVEFKWDPGVLGIVSWEPPAGG
jgi:SAM-dependent methyltransferase